MNRFDPDAAARPDSGIFGLPHDAAEARVLLLPVPYDATVSYRAGAAAAPAAILAASRQVELFDRQTGHPYRSGIHMRSADPMIAETSHRARRLALPIIAKGGAGKGDEEAVAEVEQAGEAVREHVFAAVSEIFDMGKIPGVVGGDHSVAFGAIEAAAARHEGIGLLQIDAHADLRPDFEGFRWSHACVMHKVMAELSGVERLAQVGVRDMGLVEQEAIEASAGRIVCNHDLDMQRRLAAGESFLSLCAEIIEPLPSNVWITFDIDGLDPTLCPHTGTPVPGGLSFSQACLLIEALADSGRRILGFDLCEVVPGPGDEDLDAIVAARVLYKLCGFALKTQS